MAWMLAREGLLATGEMPATPEFLQNLSLKIFLDKKHIKISNL
jgi:hypothetical protein